MTYEAVNIGKDLIVDSSTITVMTSVSITASPDVPISKTPAINNMDMTKNIKDYSCTVR